MMKFMRSLFGGGGSSNTRRVVGRSVPVDVKNVEYLAESTARLTTLYTLYKRYKGTPHEEKLKSAHDKTKAIHEYLVSRDRVHELELFHLQNTDHFISTFTVILDVHQQHNMTPLQIARVETAPEQVYKSTSVTEKIKKLEKSVNGVEMVRPINSQTAYFQKQEFNPEIARLTVPEISINTFAKIPYNRGNAAEGASAAEIGFTSTPLEKEAFLSFVATQLGIKNLSYAGNALVSIPNSNGSNPTGLVPIIHWEGFLYALNLNDFRLFPVKSFRKNF